MADMALLLQLILPFMNKDLLEQQEEQELWQC
jgi:hypothetical protein